MFYMIKQIYTYHHEWMEAGTEIQLANRMLRVNCFAKLRYTWPSWSHELFSIADTDNVENKYTNVELCIEQFPD